MALLDTDLYTLESIYLDQAKKILQQLEEERKELVDFLNNSNFVRWKEGAEYGNTVVSDLKLTLSRIENADSILQGCCNSIQNLVNNQRQNNNMRLY